MRIRRLERRTHADFGGGIERIFQDELGYSKEEGNDYTASPEAFVLKMCNGQVKEGDKILDMGCGKGYAMYLMGKYPFAGIYGLEKSARLAGDATKNLECIYGREDNRFKVFTMDATLMEDNNTFWDVLGEMDYVYMYNPFPGAVAQKVIRLLDKKARETAWQVTVWYAAPGKDSLIEMFKSECFQLKDIRSVGKRQLVYIFDSIFIEGED